MWWWDGAMPWWGMIFWPVVMLVVMFVCMGLMMGMMRGGGMMGRMPPWRRDPARDPFDILRERFARGEINKDEYEERKGSLSQP
jgi:putative membrane protein